jgi:hypothetical protein
MVQVPYRRVRELSIALGAMALVAGVPLRAEAQQPAPAISPAKVQAAYKISLNGFELGNFNFKSNVGRTSYTLDTDVQISALLGVFQWKGVTRSTGTLAAKAPKPEDFRFNYESSVRNGSVAMGFGQDGLETLTVLPATVEAADTVPLTRAHLKNVVDPLSAILVITHSSAATPCGRKVAVFDGKQRFDIDLRFARKEAVVGIEGETAIVCRVKYTPIAGYRPTEETRELAATNGIEIAFRMVPSAKLMIPQSMTLPTAAGQARIDLQSVNIEVPNGQLASAQ